MQVLELIIFAGLAGVVLYQLYAVLGRRVGRQPEDAAAADAVAANARQAPALDAVDDGVDLTGLPAIKHRDPSFDLSRFLGGSKGAYEMVVRAFAAGDRGTLSNLLAPNVLSSFEAVIDEREAQGRTEAVEFLHPPRADLERADLHGDVASITVRFLAEFRSRTKGPEGEAVDDKRTAELWTFERSLKSRDPNWLLVNVAAAEA
ncbi:preprotein translocase subunit Tim44 [Phenylobacterium sp. Root77]|uniref:TIM44-related membrane protein TimA n=1 Tax=unclassified Phenylobacterium TaxID=2640670 RepID=UPI0006FF8B5E|nr:MULTISPECIES: TIM44-related membrane protein TimA [unclassified Phenylobacterium]KQW69144.1 preprotein translocase subunit Tim44 [Phenylobacterium sp. Root1277]KQW95490.1 preprotein translocase subunit Tim44 [Phenylobacterium sp. Root1290]KRC41280.1 preprotein translocase subunit Tim44 [Phenylobacterium sp. Root77]